MLNVSVGDVNVWGGTDTVVGLAKQWFIVTASLLNKCLWWCMSRCLIISDNVIGAEGATALAVALQDNTSLTRLDVQGNIREFVCNLYCV